jgi:hypothetical protein
MIFKRATNVASILFATILVVSLALLAFAQTDKDQSDDPYAYAVQPMTAIRMSELILRIDENAIQDGSTWYFNIIGLDAVLVFDIEADRMRVLIPIENTDDLSKDELLRLMQANFDSALDARYAIAQGRLWGAYIHPLSTLTDEELLLGIGQTANVVASFGSSYSSGMFVFGGGDSGEIERKRFLEELRKEST